MAKKRVTKGRNDRRNSDRNQRNINSPNRQVNRREIVTVSEKPQKPLTNSQILAKARQLASEKIVEDRDLESEGHRFELSEEKRLKNYIKRYEEIIRKSQEYKKQGGIGPKF